MVRDDLAKVDVDGSGNLVYSEENDILVQRIGQRPRAYLVGEELAGVLVKNTVYVVRLHERNGTVDEALHLRDEARRRRRPYPPFRCRECDEFVRPHKRGTTDQAAHFEHRESSPGCPLGA